MKYIFTLAMLSLLYASCCSSVPDSKQKFDVPLKLKVEELEKTASDEVVSVFGKCTVPITDDIKKELEQSGALIATVINDTFTASGNTDQIFKLAAVEFVSQLQLSTTSEMK